MCERTMHVRKLTRKWGQRWRTPRHVTSARAVLENGGPRGGRRGNERGGGGGDGRSIRVHLEGRGWTDYELRSQEAYRSRLKREERNGGPEQHDNTLNHQEEEFAEARALARATQPTPEAPITRGVSACGDAGCGGCEADNVKSNGVTQHNASPELIVDESAHPLNKVTKHGSKLPWRKEFKKGMPAAMDETGMRITAVQAPSAMQTLSTMKVDMMTGPLLLTAGGAAITGAIRSVLKQRRERTMMERAARLEIKDRRRRREELRRLDEQVSGLESMRRRVMRAASPSTVADSSVASTSSASGATFSAPSEWTMLPPREAALRAKQRTLEQMSKTPFAITRKQTQKEEQKQKDEQERRQQNSIVVAGTAEENSISSSSSVNARHVNVLDSDGDGRTAPTQKAAAAAEEEEEEEEVEEEDIVSAKEITDDESASEHTVIGSASEETEPMTMDEQLTHEERDKELMERSMTVPSLSSATRQSVLSSTEAADIAEPGEPWAAAFEAELASTRRRELREAEAEAKQQDEAASGAHAPDCVDPSSSEQQLFGPEVPEALAPESKAEKNARLIELRKQVYAQHRLRDEAARIMQEKGLIDVSAPDELTLWWQSARVVYFIGSNTPNESSQTTSGSHRPPRADDVNLLELNLSPDPAFSMIPHCLGFESRADALNFCHFMRDLDDEDADIGLAHAAHMRQSVHVVPRAPSDIRAICAARGVGATVLPDGELVMQRGMCLGDVFATLGNDDAVIALVLNYMETQTRLIQQLAGDGVDGGVPGLAL